MQSDECMDLGIGLQIIWMDEDVVEVRVSGSNGRFAGVTDCYCAHEVFAQVASTLRGFPVSGHDRRELKLGSFEADHAGGGARIVLSCADAFGHPNLELLVRTDPELSAGRSETASFCFPVEAAAIDAFVAALQRLPVALGSAARLSQAV